ncbi:MAG: YdcF family protein [Clostridiales bacterium]|nr:YdcF family protein [Clostridiales bacterium]MDO5139839.1 YdcF family protein [Eubacteriales bacterium]
MKRKVLSLFFFICAGLCIAYFTVIIGYGGINTSFCLIWPFFAAVFTAMGIMLRRSLRRRYEMPKLLPAFIYTSFGLFLGLFVLIMNLVMASSAASEDTGTDYCIVLGARVYSDGVSKTLVYRLDKAYEVFYQDPEATLVLAGGQDKGDAVPEAFAMYNYLSMKGVPQSKMLMEARATSTSDIVMGAVRIIRKDTELRRIPKGPGDSVWSSDYEPSVGIITSDYHMFRARTMAVAGGLKDVRSIPARSDSILYIHNCVRESAAIIKDLFMGNLTVDESHMPKVPFNRRKSN